jgi:Carboxypeptidase regulatory-like domain
MQVIFTVVGLVLLGTQVARAAAPDAPDPTAEPPGRARIEVRGGLALRDDRLVTGDERVNATGAAVSELVASGAWFPGGRPFGVAASMEMERFGLRDEETGRSLAMAGLELTAAVTGRMSGVNGRLTLEGMLGYAYLDVPLARQGGSAPMPLWADPVHAHGPLVGARLAYAPGVPWLAVEAAVRAVPVSTGGESSGTAMPLRRAAASAGAVLGHLDRTGLRWSAVVLYEIGRTWVDTGTASLAQIRQQVSLGVRASFRGPRPPAPPPAPGPVALPRGRMAGLVRAAPTRRDQPPGPPLADVSITIGGVQVASTDAEGAFVVDGLVPGVVRVHLSGPGLVEADEAVSVPAEGEARVEVSLHSSAEAATAALIGLVRDESGAPVAAAVKILELGLAAAADPRGQFRFNLPPGRYTLVIAAPGFVTQRKTVQAAPGEQNIYNVDLAKER